MAVSGLTRLVVAHADVINVDEASYMVGASSLLHGQLPYTAFGDNKPPLIYLYFALSQLLAGQGIAAVRLVTALLTVPLTALGVSAFYRHDRRGIVGALLLIVYGVSFRVSDMLAVNCEVVMMLPLAWSLVAVRDSEQARRPERVFLAGLLAGNAILVKYQAVLWLPPLALAIAVAHGTTRRRGLIRAGVALALGVLTPVLLTTTIFAVLGGLDGFVYWNLTHNVEYMQNPVTPLQALTRGLRQGLPFLAVTSLLWVGWFRSSREGQTRYWDVLVAGLIGASAAAACLGFRFFPHYFVQLYVPLAIAAAPWTARLLTPPVLLRGWVTAVVTLAIAVGWTMDHNRRLGSETLARLNATPLDIAEVLQRDSCYSGSSMFVWGSAPEFYYHAKLLPATQFFFPEYPLVRYYAGNPLATSRHAPSGRRPRRMRHWTRLMSDLRRARPTFILDTAASGIARWQDFPLRDYPMLHRYTERNYHQVRTIGGVTIYRRNGCETEARNEVW